VETGEGRPREAPRGLPAEADAGWTRWRLRAAAASGSESAWWVGGGARVVMMEGRWRRFRAEVDFGVRGTGGGGGGNRRRYKILTFVG
jgi:hypothetical protein